MIKSFYIRDCVKLIEFFLVIHLSSLVKKNIKLDYRLKQSIKGENPNTYSTVKE